MSQEVLAALERLEAAIMELELNQGAVGEATAEAQVHLRQLLKLCMAQRLRELEPPCHWLGSLLDLLSDGKAQAGQEMVDLLLGPVDFMRRLIFIASGGTPSGPPPGAAGELVPAARPSAPPAGQTGEAGDAPAAKPGEGAPPPALRNLPAAIKVETEKLDGLLDILGELVITYALSSRHSALAQDQNRGLQENLQTLGGLLENLERQVAAIRMLQLNNLFMRMQRLVRDVSAKVGKKVELVVQGGEVELDKALIEELNDPLVHLLRNAVDHGVEDPRERQAAGKVATAKLELRAERQEQFLVITVADDGRGLDRERILAKAREKGLLVPGRVYSDQEIYQLITEPGFSTAAQVTDISGRGVGLDVVARAVVQMGAELVIASQPGQGSTFSIRMPLNRVVSDGITEAIIVMAGGEMFAIPSRRVMEVVAYDPARVFDVSEYQVVDNRGVYYPLLDLAQVMDCPGRGQAPPTILIITLVGGREVAMIGEELVGHQQVVMRSLDKRAFPAVTTISGCALMGDKMGLMLDLEGLSSHLASPELMPTAPADLEDFGFDSGIA